MNLKLSFMSYLRVNSFVNNVVFNLILNVSSKCKLIKENILWYILLGR